MLANEFLEWSRTSQFIYPVLLSLIAALIFWIIFSFIPESLRRKKLRPVVELNIFEIYQTLFAVFDLIMKYRENGPSFYQKKIRSGKLSQEDIKLGLQNKCLNDSYLFDDNVKAHLLCVGQSIYDYTVEVERLIHKILNYNQYASANELILLENIENELRRYDYGNDRINKPAHFMIGEEKYYPSVSIINYRQENFYDLYALFCRLQDIIMRKLPIQNRNHILSKTQYLYYSGKYKECRKFIKSKTSLPESDIMFLKIYAALCEYSLKNFEKFYFVFEDVYKNRPHGGNLASSRNFLENLIENKKIIEIITKYHSNDEIQQLLAVIKSEALEKNVSIEINKKLSEYFAKRDPRLSPINSS